MDIKTEIEFTRNLKATEHHTECQTEYTLPDYNPDVRKILFTSAEVKPAGKFAGDEKIEFSGIIVYNLVYSDAENNISSTSFTSDYDYDVKYNPDSYKDAFTETRVSNFALRLTGPRKVSAKATLCSRVRICENESLRVSGNSFAEGAAPEVKTKTVRLRESTAAQSIEREYAESLARLDGAISDEVSVIHSFAEATCDEVSVDGESATIKGNLRLCAVLKNADAPAYPVEKTIPIEESLTFEKLGTGAAVIPELTVTSLKSSVNPNDDGCEVVLSAIVEMSAVSEANVELSLLTDAYTRTHATENTYEDFYYNELLSVSCEKMTHTAEISRYELDLGSLRELLFVSAVPRLESVTATPDGAVVRGEVRYSGVASELCDDGNVAYIPVKFSSEFEKNVNINCQTRDKMTFEASVDAGYATVSIDTEKLVFSSVLNVCVKAACEGKATRLASCETLSDMPFTRNSARVVVYYPDSSETLFAVAKKFHTTREKIALDNSLDASCLSGGDESLGGVKKLFIY